MSPLAGRLLTSSKPGAGLPCALVMETQVRVNLIWPALIAFALLPFGVKLSLPQSSSGGAFISFPQRPLGLVPLQQLAERGVTPSPNQGNWFG